MAATFLGDNPVRREMRTKPLDDQPFRTPVGLSDEIEIALQLKSDFPLEEVRQQRTCFPCDFDSSFEIRCHYVFERDASLDSYCGTSYRYLMSCL